MTLVSLEATQRVTFIFGVLGDDKLGRTIEKWEYSRLNAPFLLADTCSESERNPLVMWQKE